MYRLKIPTSKRSHLYISLCLLLAAHLCGAPRALAYHFFYVSSGGANLPVKWRTLPVNFIVDNGSVDILPEIQTATTTWNNVTTAQNVFAAPTRATVDFTGANFGTAWGNLTGDGQQEVVFDQDGTAFAAVGLAPASVNGYGATQRQVSGGQGAITDAFLLLNGTRTNFDRRSTEVHEFGHIQGLAHSSVGMNNSAAFPSDALDVISITSVPTMHPFSANTGTSRQTLEADDIAALSELYPEASFATSFGSIEGTVTRCATGNAAIIGANVRAVNTSNSSIQLSRFTGFDGNTTGRFVINGLPPGSYRLIVEPMGANGFTLDRFGSPPIRADVDFPTEYHNPPQEDACSEELPDTAVPIAVTAGGSATGKNFKVGSVDLAFVVDDTGSMSEEIGGVRIALTQFVNILNGLSMTLGTPFPNTAIVTFKDNVTKRLVSNDPARLHAVIDALTASGGDDCPESSNSALLTAGQLLRNGGVALLITDADSRPDGPDRNSVTQLYRSKSLTLSTLLSGTCTGTLSSPPIDPLDPLSTQSGQSTSAPSENYDEYPLPATLGIESAVRTYSELSTQTGGVFTAIPGINSSDTTERQRYINTATNIAVSAAVPAVSLVLPGNGPQGTTLNVEIKGANTNFQSSSVVAFSGTGITVNSRIINSPGDIIATVTIAPDATLGFRDVTVTTNLSGSSVETATGFGAFNIITRPTAPIVTSVTPSEGAQGQTLNVTINGVNTNFVNGSSVANFGTGITVNSLTVTGPTTAVANLTISPTATIGLRDVRVTTGAEVATESIVGPFLVTAPPPVIPRISSINPLQGRQTQTLNVTITGENTSFVNGTSVVSFSGTGITVNSTAVTSPTTAVANITISLAAPLGFRDIFVTTGSQVAAALSTFLVLEAPDTIAPLLTCPTNVTVTTAAGQCAATVSPGTATATDDRDGTVTPTSARSDGQALTAPYPVGVTTITWSARDAANNVATCQQTITVNALQTIQLDAASYTVSEGANFIPITVTRTCSTASASPASINFATSDGTASQRADYTLSSGALFFAAGESSKTFNLLVNDDAYAEGNETLTITLSNPTGGTVLGSQVVANITITDNDAGTPTSNPIDDAANFVRQNYHDILAREPEPGGLEFWTGEITKCGTDAACVTSRRNAVSAAFFIEQEFQRTGFFLYLVTKSTFGTRSSYDSFMRDRSSILETDLDASKTAFLNQWVQRPEFLARYPASQSGPQFIDAILATVQAASGITFTTAERDALIADYNANASRARVLRLVVENTRLQQAEYNSAFVQTQYFGYLRRDPEEGGFQFWLDVLNNKVPGNYLSLVCAFITSREYQERFSSVVTRSNLQCGN